MPHTIGTYENEIEYGRLSLYDLSETIRRAGRGAGFIVHREHQVRIDGRARSRKIDWVWLHSRMPNEIVAAFEIEGVWVPSESLLVDAEKFATLRPGCPKVVALYSVNADHTPRMMPACPTDRASAMLAAHGCHAVKVHVDVEFSLAEVLTDVIEEALQYAKTLEAVA
jgi:hypothetical protein